MQSGQTLRLEVGHPDSTECRAAIAPFAGPERPPNRFTPTGSCRLGMKRYHIPMKAVVDSVGRVVVPKPLRDALGLQPGAEVEISRYGAGLQLVPAGRTAQIVVEGGVPVVTGSARIDDETVFGLLDTGRR